MNTQLWSIALLVTLTLFSLGASANPPPAQAQPHQAPIHARRYPANDPALEERVIEEHPNAAPHRMEPEFNPYLYRFAVGMEGPALTGTSILSESAVALSTWWDRNFGTEFYFGYSRSADTLNTSTATALDTTFTNKTVTTTYSGAANVSQLMVGAAVKWRIHQRKHFGVSADFLGTFNPGGGVTYQSGSHAETTPNTATPTTYNVQETNYGPVNVSLAPTFRLGPRITVDYYLPFLPNLMLGATFGIFTSFGGSQTTTSTLRTQTYAVTNGVAATPTADSTATQTSVQPPGTVSNTYGLGGTGINIGTGGGLSPLTMVGTFRIRYAF